MPDPVYVRPDLLDQIQESFNPHVSYRDVQPDEQDRWERPFVHEWFPKTRVHDGILISYAMFLSGMDAGMKAKLRTMGAHEFYRTENALNPQFVIGDSGGFSLRKKEEVTINVEDVAAFYTEAALDYGISLDLPTMSYDGDRANRLFTVVDDEQVQRVEQTRIWAGEFKDIADGQTDWEPVGAVQGFDHASMIETAMQYVDMGYEYLAVALARAPKARQIKLEGLRQVIESIPSNVRIHILGWGDAVTMAEPYWRKRIYSYDARTPHSAGQSEYWHVEDINVKYPCIPIPRHKSIKGAKATEELISAEKNALLAFQSLNAWKGGRDREHYRRLEEVVASLRHYRSFDPRDRNFDTDDEHGGWIEVLEQRVWEQCSCRLCTERGAWVMVLRDTSTTWSRGFHNWYAFACHRNRLNLP